MADVTAGYVAGPGGLYKLADRSGPYAVDSNGVPFLMAPTAQSGGAQSVDTIVRGAASYVGGTIAAGGAAQSFLVANLTRRGFTIQNQSTGDLYIKIGGTATISNASLKIVPNGIYETPPHHVSTGAVSIIGATTGQAYFGTEF